MPPSPQDPPANAMVMACEAVLALLKVDGNWEIDPHETAARLGVWLHDRQSEGVEHPELDLVGALADVAVGLARLVNHFAPGQAELALNGGAAQANA